MNSKYVDVPSIVQVIGCVYNNPTLLDATDKYFINEDDFPNPFHKVMFGVIYKLYSLGSEKININNIEDYLENRPKAQKIYLDNKGSEWITNASDHALGQSFDVYYNKMKKMTLLRAYEAYGVDVTWLYDPDNIIDIKKKAEQEDLLDSLSLVQISNKINDKIDEIKSKYVDNAFGISSKAGDGIEDLINTFKQSPEVGIPLYGSMINSITRGARLKKFYLRSAPSGCGKSRSMVADICSFACDRIYDSTFGWIKSGSSQPSVFITTEQEISEVQTMMLAFISDVNEEHILNGKYENDEEERVMEAAKILQKAPLYIEELPDFSLQDIENCIKRNIRDNNILYVGFDYIHTSLKILEEISKRSGGVKLREDNILFMLSIRLKDLCNQYGIFILSSTQLNGEWRESDTPDQNLLRGAKSIADKIDVGEILLPVSSDDLKALEKIIGDGVFNKPTLKLSIYKNRRGRYKGIYLWCDADLGTCRVNPMFATDWTYELIQINNLKINVDGPSAF